MYIPSPVVSGPPVNVKDVPAATSELHPRPSDVVHVPEGRAAGSLLKMTLLSDIVRFPVDPVSNVFVTLAEASETKSKPPTRTATAPKPRLTIGSLPNHVPEIRVINMVLLGHPLE